MTERGFQRQYPTSHLDERGRWWVVAEWVGDDHGNITHAKVLCLDDGEMQLLLLEHLERDWGPTEVYGDGRK